MSRSIDAKTIAHLRGGPLDGRTYELWKKSAPVRIALPKSGNLSDLDANGQIGYRPGYKNEPATLVGEYVYQLADDETDHGERFYDYLPKG